MNEIRPQYRTDPNLHREWVSETSFLPKRVFQSALICLLVGWTAFQAGAAEPPHVVVIGGDAEYGSRETCAAIADKLRNEFGFQTTVINSMVGVLENEDNPDKSLPGLDVINEADLMIIFVRMRIPPQEQLDLLHAYFESGKPAIGMRTTTHGFTNDRGWCPRYFGGHYWTHLGGTLDATVVPEMRDHPVLRGVRPRFFQDNNSLYITNPLGDSAKPLVYGKRDRTSPAQAFAWINEYKPGSRQFFFTASHPDNFQQPDNQALLYNAIHWALGKEVPAGGVLHPGGSLVTKFETGHIPAPPALKAPAHAQVLFDGDDLSQWDFWFGGKEPVNAYHLDGRAHSGAGLPEFDGARWKIEDGAAVAAPTFGDIITRERFTDYTLHLDFLVPRSPQYLDRMWRGNSGVFLNSYYEIQILDSQGTPLDEISCGAITGEHAPLVDGAKRFGEWQNMEITFSSARYRDGRRVLPARTSVVLNGQTVQEDVILDDPTTWGTLIERRSIRGLNGPLSGHIRLQADSSPVRFANIWIEETNGPTNPRRQLTGKPWIDMDYGPFKTHSLGVYKGNIANKGIAIRVDPGEGGISSGNEFMLFETDTLRYAAGWTGPEFNDWRNIMHNGEHGVYASIVGNTVFSNPDAPGWAGPDGQFNETRFPGREDRYYGPMDKKVGQWKGLYLHGNQVVLSYRVGETDVLELPGAEGSWSQRAFSRTLNIGPRSRDLILQVAHQEGVPPQLRPIENNRQMAVFPAAAKQAGRESADVGRPWMTFDGNTRLQISKPETFDFTTSDFTFYARIKTEADGSIFSKTAIDREWMPLGTTFFVRDDRLGYDIGWVGAVEGETEVTDGDWHRVALTFEAKSGKVQIYLDGKLDGEETLILDRNRNEDADEIAELMSEVREYGVQLGFTSRDFPSEDGEFSYFEGDLGDVRFYNTRLTAKELQGLGRRRSEYSDPRIVARWDFRNVDREQGVVKTAQGDEYLAKIQVNQDDTPGENGGVTVAALAGETHGAKWISTPDGHLRLKIPAGNDKLAIKILISQVRAADDAGAFEELVVQSAAAIDLTPLTKGGPSHWTETLTTLVKPLGRQDGPFVVESITLPVENSYNAWMRTGGFDFFKDPRRAAICTVMGDVWTVDGLGGELNEVTWKRIATGMYEPLGVKIVDEQIYVTCRDQIVRLHDFNGDGETDFYESFNHDHLASEHYHEFAQCLETDAEGNFYYVKATGHAVEGRTPHHGALIKVSKDGATSEIIANGFRAPNGLWVSPGGDFFLTTDQEGHWTPKNRVNWVEPGDFQGYMMAWHDEGRDQDDFVPPIVWMHNKYDRSPSEAFFIESEKWGPLDGTMAHISYGTGKVYRVMYETAANGLRQGGISEFDIRAMPTGLQRCRFNPADGQMYLLGLFIWCSDKTQPGGFYRVRYTGKKLYMPSGLNVARDGVVIRFTDPLDLDSAGNSGNYSVEIYKYLRRREYGSADYKVFGQGEGHDALDIKSVTVSSDRKSVFLELPRIQPVMQMHIDLNLKAADGKRIRTYVHNTIHALGKEPGRIMLNTNLAANESAASQP